MVLDALIYIKNEMDSTLTFRRLVGARSCPLVFARSICNLQRAFPLRLLRSKGVACLCLRCLRTDGRVLMVSL